MKNINKCLYFATSALTIGILATSTSLNAHGPGQGDPSGNLDPLTAEIQMGATAIRLQPVADGLIAPTWAVTPPGLDRRLFTIEQNGIVWNLNLDDGNKSVFFDVGDRLVALGLFGPGSYDERGLLGIAFHPDYATNGLFYTYTSEANQGAADYSTMPPGAEPNHQSVVAEWQVNNPSTSDPSVLMESRRELLRVDQPQFNHNGGALDFGPDRMLYIAYGDGGAADDEGVGHGSNGNAQDPANPLGSILRIDPLGRDSDNGRYGIPSDNPYLSTPGYLEETYAYGFRNPYRMSFDRLSGDFYVGDVGQNDVEEVDLVVSGGNYGWRYKEGSFFFDKDGDPEERGSASSVDPGGIPGGLIDPVAEYDTHTEGHSVIGGFVYRGNQFPELNGRYIFGEFAKSLDFGAGLFTEARIFYLDADAPNGVTEFDYGKGKRGKGLRSKKHIPYALFGFGQDAAGELYFLGNTTGTPYAGGENLDQPTGVVLRLVGE